MMKRINHSTTSIIAYNKFKILIISLITFCLFAGAGLLIINPISAQESEAKENKKNEFANRVAAILNIEPSELSAAMEKVKIEIGEENKQRKLGEAKSNLDKKVQSGVITQEKADKIYGDIQDKINSRESKKPQYKLGKSTKKFKMLPQALKFKSHLGNKIENGSITKGQASTMWKKHLGKFNKAKVKKPLSAENLRANLDKKVESGSITQEKANEIYENFLSRKSKQELLIK